MVLITTGISLATLGMLGSFGLLTLAKFKYVKGDWKQLVMLSSSLYFLIGFSIWTSMQVKDRDFPDDGASRKYNVIDGAMTYSWRSIPQVYIPVDYYKKNETYLRNS